MVRLADVLAEQAARVERYSLLHAALRSDASAMVGHRPGTPSGSHLGRTSGGFPGTDGAGTRDVRTGALEMSRPSRPPLVRSTFNPLPACVCVPCLGSLT